MSEEQEIQALIDVLDAFPMQKGAPEGFQVAIPVESRKSWAMQLRKRGVRVHADLAEEVSVTGDQPGMGRFNPRKWVPKDQAESAVAEPAVEPDGMRDAAAALLEMTNPAMADRIRSLSPEDVPEFLKELESQVPDAVANLQSVREQIEPEPEKKPPAKKAARKAAPKKRAPKKS